MTLTLRIVNRAGKTVASRRFAVASGRRSTIKARLAGLAGRYSYRITAGKRTLRRGNVTLKADPRVTVLLPKGKRVILTPAA